MHSQFMKDMAQLSANYHCIKFDAERDAADLKKREDEKTFINEFLHNHEDVENMADNVDSISDIEKYLRSELGDYLSDKHHDEGFWND